MFDPTFDTAAQLDGVCDTLERLAHDVDPGSWSGPEAVRVVATLGRIRRLTDGLLARAAKRVEDTAAHSGSQARDAAGLCARLTGTSASEVRREIVTATRLELLPEAAEAVASGRLSARQAELVADAAVRNPGAERRLLVAAAEGLVPLRDECVTARAEVEDAAPRARRQHAARCLRIWSAPDGMVEGRFRLEPIPGARLKATIDDETRRIFRAARKAGVREPQEAYAADALCRFGERGTAGDRKTARGAKRGGTRVNVHIVVDHGAIVRGNVLPGERCEIPGVGPVNVEHVRDLLGEAFLTAVVRKGRDITTVAHLGRYVPAELRTALVVSGRECDIEGCHVRGYLELDHSQVDHADGGLTAWWNLTWLCSQHHRRKTRGETLGPPDARNGKRRLGPRPPGGKPTRSRARSRAPTPP